MEVILVALICVWFAVMCFVAVTKTELFLNSWQGSPEERIVKLQQKRERDKERRDMVRGALRVGKQVARRFLKK